MKLTGTGRVQVYRQPEDSLSVTGSDIMPVLPGLILVPAGSLTGTGTASGTASGSLRLVELQYR